MPPRPIASTVPSSSRTRAIARSSFRRRPRARCRNRSPSRFDRPPDDRASKTRAKPRRRVSIARRSALGMRRVSRSAWMRSPGRARTSVSSLRSYCETPAGDGGVSRCGDFFRRDGGVERAHVGEREAAARGERFDLAHLVDVDAAAERVAFARFSSASTIVSLMQASAVRGGRFRSNSVAGLAHAFEKRIAGHDACFRLRSPARRDVRARRAG